MFRFLRAARDHALGARPIAYMFACLMAVPIFAVAYALLPGAFNAPTAPLETVVGKALRELTRDLSDAIFHGEVARAVPDWGCQAQPVHLRIAHADSDSLVGIFEVWFSGAVEGVWQGELTVCTPLADDEFIPFPAESLPCSDSALVLVNAKWTLQHPRPRNWEIPSAVEGSLFRQRALWVPPKALGVEDSQV